MTNKENDPANNIDVKALFERAGLGDALRSVAREGMRDGVRGSGWKTIMQEIAHVGESFAGVVCAETDVIDLEIWGYVASNWAWAQALLDNSNWKARDAGALDQSVLDILEGPRTGGWILLRGISKVARLGGISSFVWKRVWTLVDDEGRSFNGWHPGELLMVLGSQAASSDEQRKVWERVRSLDSESRGDVAGTILGAWVDTEHGYSLDWGVLELLMQDVELLWKSVDERPAVLFQYMNLCEQGGVEVGPLLEGFDYDGIVSTIEVILRQKQWHRWQIDLLRRLVEENSRFFVIYLPRQSGYVNDVAQGLLEMFAWLGARDKAWFLSRVDESVRRFVFGKLGVEQGRAGRVGL